MASRAIRLGILLAAALSACYSPYEPDCGFVCGSDGACPDNYTCAADRVCHLNGTSPTKTCSEAPLEFDIASAMSTSNVAISITFTGVPNAAQAQDLSNYDIPGLTLGGGSMLAGSTITIGTASQSAMTYTVTVSNVTRVMDMQPLTTNTASFTGRASFEVLSAASSSNTEVVVTYNNAPDAAAATDIANYSIPGLTLTGTPVLSGAAVTLTTSPQLAQSYSLSVMNVKRASDFEPLRVSTATFTGRGSFDVTGASSVDNTHVTVIFDGAPVQTQAMTASNYAIPGLTVSAATVSGSAVTLTTTTQSAISYTVTVSNVTRSSDSEALTTTDATFTGTP
jgi:hypothetical protein